MPEIFNFKPKNKLDAEKNLQQFIQECRDELTVFGEDLKWSQWQWDGVVQFTKLGVNSMAAKDKDALDERFIEFAKAYFRYQQGHKPTGAKNEIKALKALEYALLQGIGKADIAELSYAIIDEAAQIVRDNYSKGAAYHGGRELERLAKFVVEKRLVSCDVSGWKNPISRLRDTNQTGKKAKKDREKKLPSEEALNAMAEIFSTDPENPRDIFTSSIFAMTMCAPSRITEILELPVDCEVEDIDNNGVVRYGWRFYAGKGYGGDIKWIPTEMVPVAKKAIERIRRLTEPARKLAKWMEENPDKFYRHDKCSTVSDNKALTNHQVCEAIGIVAVKSPRSILGKLNYKNINGSYTLETLWKHIKTKQPEFFPWFNKKKKIKYSNALFCMTRNLLHRQRGTNPVILWKPTNNVFNNDLSPRKSLKSDSHKSIFDRYGYLDKNGVRLKLTSHQARHLLNTIAQRGGLSQIQIAKWSGRADVKQNRTYNHMDEYEMVAQAEALDTSLALFGPVGVVNNHLPVTIQEFNTMEKGAAHITEFGLCIHDYTMSPCEKYRDCLNCTEQVCIKGEQERLSRIHKRLAEVEQLYQAAKDAMNTGMAGADRWYEHHKNTVVRLRELVGILENPDIEDGTLIKLKNDKAFSPLSRAVASKLPHASRAEASMLNDMSDLLGGGLG